MVQVEFLTIQIYSNHKNLQNLIVFVELLQKDIRRKTCGKFWPSECFLDYLTGQCNL